MEIKRDIYLDRLIRREIMFRFLRICGCELCEA